jgi:molecular chaperone GrpE
VRAAGGGPDRGRQGAGARGRAGGPRGTDEPDDANVVDDDSGRATPGPEAVESPEAPEPPAGDYKDRWLRAEAELQNARRRAQRDREEAVRFAEDRVLLDAISLVDDLERGLEAARQAEAPESWTEGLRLALNRMDDTLGRHGVVALEPLGEPFDPRFHEALMEVDPQPGMAPGAVGQVLRKGYRRDERVLRPARVAVVRREAGKES